MKVLHLYTDLNITCGVTSVINNIVTFQNPDSVKHKIAVLGGDAISLFRAKGVEVKLLSFKKKKLSLIPLCIEVLYYCWNNQIDIIHSHHRYMDMISYIVGHIYRIKMITTVHSIVTGKQKLSYKINNIVAVSHAARNYLIDYFNVQPQNIRVIHNAVKFPEEKTPISRDSLRKQLNINSDTKVILYAGRFDFDKGIDILLKAIKILSKNSNNLKVIVIGSGSMEEWIHDFIKDNILPVTVIKPSPHIFDYYKVADIVVLASRVDNFPMVMLEAGIMQKAFVGTSVYGIKELICNNYEGLLVESENILKLADALKHLLNDEPLRKRLAENLYEKVVKEYLVQHKMPLYYNLYKEV